METSRARRLANSSERRSSGRRSPERSSMERCLAGEEVIAEELVGEELGWSARRRVVGEELLMLMFVCVCV
jgi:hypothetical protein